MAAHPVVIVDDELLQKLPQEFQRDPRYQKGASLELIPVSARAKSVTGEEALAIWESLRGILANSSHDPNAELEREKQHELEEEAGWARS